MLIKLKIRCTFIDVSGFHTLVSVYVVNENFMPLYQRCSSSQAVRRVSNKLKNTEVQPEMLKDRQLMLHEWFYTRWVLDIVVLKCGGIILNAGDLLSKIQVEGLLCKTFRLSGFASTLCQLKSNNLHTF